MASIINKTFYVDMWNPNYIKTIALQREALGRELRFYITSDSIPVNLTGITVLIYAKKPDNTSIYATCTKITEVSGYCSITMDSQFMAVKGTVQCWLKLVSPTGSVISPPFNIEVLETPDIDSLVESQNEFSVFQSLTSQITQNTSNINALTPLVMSGTDNPTPTNLNTYITTGRYSIGNAALYTNIPTVTEVGAFIVDKCGSFIIQMYKTATTEYTRFSFNGTTWSSWVGCALHQYKSTTATHAVNSAGAQAIALGFSPKFVRIRTRFTGTNFANYDCDGSFDGAGYGAVYTLGNGTTPPATTNVSIIYMHSGSAENYATCTFTATGITLTWIGSGFPSGNFVMSIEAWS